MTALEMRVRSFKSSTDMNGPGGRGRAQVMGGAGARPPPTRAGRDPRFCPNRAAVHGRTVGMSSET